MRYVAWACLLAILLAAASPVAAGGAPPAILAPAGPVLGGPVVTAPVRPSEHAALPDLGVATDVPARAPPLA